MPLCLVQAWSEACYVIQSSQQSSETNMTIISMQEENQGAEGHRASVEWSWDINLGNLAPMSSVSALDRAVSSGKVLPISEELSKFFLSNSYSSLSQKCHLFIPGTLQSLHYN